MTLTQPINVVLTTKITETLTKPEIAFGVAAPDGSSQVRETLASKMSNDDERIVQFGSILVLNNFNVVNSGLKFDVSQTALNTVSGLPSSSWDLFLILLVVLSRSI
jgi:hypothetical protein